MLPKQTYHVFIDNLFSSPNLFRALKKKKKKKRKEDDFRDELVARFDKLTFQRLLIQWITDANLSFRVSEYEGLQKVFGYLDSLVQETSANLRHKTIRIRIINEFHTYKAHIMDTLLQSPSQVHIAFDGWTSRTDIPSSPSTLFSLMKTLFGLEKLSWDFQPSPCRQSDALCQRWQCS
jgi:hypothetical protein